MNYQDALTTVKKIKSILEKGGYPQAKYDLTEIKDIYEFVDLWQEVINDTSETRILDFLSSNPSHKHKIPSDLFVEKNMANFLNAHEEFNYGAVKLDYFYFEEADFNNYPFFMVPHKFNWCSFYGAKNLDMADFNTMPHNLSNYVPFVEFERCVIELSVVEKAARNLKNGSYFIFKDCKFDGRNGKKILEMFELDYQELGMYVDEQSETVVVKKENGEVRITIQINGKLSPS